MKYFLFLLCFCLTAVMAQEQTLYKTVNGHVVIVGEQDSTRVIAESHKAFVIFNYNRAEMIATLSLKTLDTGIDSLNKFLHSIKEDELKYTGKLGVDHINTKEHPLQSFDIIGKLTLNSVTKGVTFKATLRHLSNSSTYACMLTAGATIQLEDFNINSTLLRFNETINIEIAEAILRKER